ncbi:MAP3K epsilon protein kinase 1-like [Dendrobium catenatum]|uniref:non-specific serine/threonine protein kinase n=1 Tax=Dendrobium catenatum TaxID=906689 RepID=A0A2I0WI49_9ASPA|nr:MAP3K epsilon protein kinase 1-like [Dendrobium catenatum]PKU75336.1 Mitogen-activated protein kinase kinase kinase NPK1 [Dendrobium catenatum]
MSRHPATAHFHKSKTLYDKYMLGDEIGKGAYGRVYKGLDLENGDFVAIKQVSLENISQEDLNIIMQEIDLLKNLNHKNIVKYLGSLKTKTHLHIILEYVENGSLANIIKPNKFGPFPESLVAVYISQVLEGLVYLHEQGVIHRDIKGANILTTKEGLVKLADFGVATKLNEADLNTHSVVGTPYWMAPEVIEMSGVCAASDIWSVGCTVIELLTCVPPYYELQPMPALFRIVQDPHPPIPEGLSTDITDFLRQCFKKDALQRPDARTLLQHPWIQNSKRALQSSLREIGGSLKNIDEDAAITENNSVGNILGVGGPSEGTVKGDDTNLEKVKSERDSLASSSLERNGTDESQTGKNNITQDTSPEGVDSLTDDVLSARDPTLVFHQKPMASSSVKEASSANSKIDNPQILSEPSPDVANGLVRVAVGEGENGLDVERDDEGSSSPDESSLFSFRAGMRKFDSHKVMNPSTVTGVDDLSRFRDSPGDALLDDLFQPLDRVPGDQGAEVSTSTTDHGNVLSDGAKSYLAKELKARMAQKHLETEIKERKGGKLLDYVMDVIDIDGPVFEENLPAENIFLIQSVEFNKLVGLLKPEKPEDVILSACQKLLSFFVQRPEQKHVFVSQHGFLPLIDLLEIPRNRVICSVLQIINQIVMDNVGFQENACLVGLIPVVMNFAVPDRPREVRIQAAFFLQQLCQSSTLTLQMFIACRGIPVLVGFLEADYAKYREMVHLAIDGIRHVFKLQHSTPRNDFCRIAAKNGILLRLVNILHSMNETARLASVQNGAAARPRSGPLDVPHTVVAAESFHLSASTSGPVANMLEMKQFFGDADKNHLGNAPLEASLSSKASEIVTENSGNTTNRGSSAAASEEHEHSGLWKPDIHRLEADLIRQQRSTDCASRTSTDKPIKHVDLTSNGHPSSVNTLSSQKEQVRPLLSLFNKEPPSRNVSGQLDYVRNLPALERHESILPLLHSSAERKTNGELELLMAEFAEVSRQGKEIERADFNGKLSKRASTKVLPQSIGSTTSNEGASTSSVASQTASGVLSGSGVLNARPGSTTSSGLLSQMVSSLNADVAREYLEKVVDLLLEFAQADSTVKSYMCSQSLLARLFQMFNKIEPPILTKILMCINHLSGDPNCLDSLQRAEAIKHLIPNLGLHEGPFVSQIHGEVLSALFNLCKINKRRQEQAAENGIIPHLMNFILSDSNLKLWALSLLCDMAYASRNSREQLRVHGGLDVYLNLLEDEAWAVTALDSLAVCLAHDSDHRKVEQALLKKEAIQKLVKFFQNCPQQYFVNILEPFLKIITKSPRINTAMATNGLTTQLISRLDHQDAIARLNLLKLIKAVYEHHPRPKQLIVENDLPQKLQNLIEERRDGQRSGRQVLVKQMATALLKALHINTVL